MSVSIRESVRLRPRRRAAILIVGALAAVGLSACSSESDDPGATKDTLIVAVDRGLGSLNPAVDAGASGAGFVLYYPYATLVEKNPEDGTPGPGLAESFGYVGEGNMTYELQLRPDLLFADGTPLDSEAVKQWLTYFPTAGGGYSALLDIKSVETPDPLTVRINLNTPTPLVTDALTNAWGMVISPDALGEPDQLAAGAPGAGPYVYDQGKTVTGTGATYTLVPNENYYDQDAIKWSEIVVKVIEDPGTRLRAMQTGTVDVAMGSVTTVQTAEDEGINVSSAASGMVSINVIDANGDESKALGDARVRQALSYAIDRASIAEALFQGVVEPTSSLITSDGSDPALQDLYPYDPDKAKQLLADAGYPEGFEFKLVATSFGSLVGSPLIQAVAANWADVGVDVEVVAAGTQAEFVDKFLTGSAFMADYPPFPTLTLATAWYSETSGTNAYKVDYPLVDELRIRAQTAPQEQQTEIAKELVRVIAEQAYAIPITTKPALLYSTDEVQGVEAKGWLNSSPAARGWSPS